jgi:hypothetical protein
MTSRTAIIDAIETLRQARCTSFWSIRERVATRLRVSQVRTSPLRSLDGVNLAARVSGLTPEEYAEWIELTAPVSLLAASRAATR